MSTNSSRLKKEFQVLHIKSMLMNFFNIQGNVQKEFVPHIKSVNGLFDCYVLRHLRKSVRHKWSEMLKEKILYWPWKHAFIDLFCCEGSHNKKHDFCSPPTWLASCDFYLYPNMKLQLIKPHFNTNEEIQVELQQVLNTLWPANFQECFQKWEN